MFLVQEAEDLTLGLASAHGFVEVGRHNSQTPLERRDAFLEMSGGSFILKAGQSLVIRKEKKLRCVAFSEPLWSIESTGEPFLRNHWQDQNQQAQGLVDECAAAS